MLDKTHRPAYSETDCGYGYSHDPMTGKYEYRYSCSTVDHDDEYSLVVRWRPRRWQDGETVTVEEAHIEKRLVSTDEYYMCNIGNIWNRTQKTCTNG